MHVAYADDCLARLAVDPSFHPAGYPPELIRAFRQGLQSLKAASSPTDLQQVMILDLRTEHDRIDACASIRLIPGARLLLEFGPPPPTEVTVVGIAMSTLQGAKQ